MAGVSPAFREALVPVLTAFADDELVIGHRHSEWTGWAPHIEEDIAFSSIAQDEIGHAALYFGLLAEMTERSADEWALAREPGEFRHAIICERPNDDWAFTLARHFHYEIAERIRLESLVESSYKPLAAAAGKLLREERYHQLHADAWFRRLATGPIDGRHQFSLALSRALPEAVGLFEIIEGEETAVENGIISQPSSELLQVWLNEVMDRLDAGGLSIDLTPAQEEEEVVATAAGEMIDDSPEPSRPPSIVEQNGNWAIEGELPGMGGRLGRHTEDFESLWEDLTRTYREEPTATW